MSNQTSLGRVWFNMVVPDQGRNRLVQWSPA